MKLRKKIEVKTSKNGKLWEDVKLYIELDNGNLIRIMPLEFTKKDNTKFSNFPLLSVLAEEIE